MISWRPDLPHNDLPPLPPAVELETRAVLKQCISARAALAELKQVCTRIKGVQMQVRRVPGTALARQASGAIIYTPPVGEDLLRTQLANWERYLNEAENPRRTHRPCARCGGLGCSGWQPLPARVSDYPGPAGRCGEATTWR